jgi:hypothetical protein
MKIIDNFLSKEQHLLIKKIMLGNSFPWFISNIISEVKDLPHGKEFSHFFYSNHSPNSEFYYLMDPLIQKINPNSLIRIRAACMPRIDKQKEFGWHTDFDFTCTTAIYYVNTNNGYTKFKNGTVVESLENRFVSFDSQEEHLGVHCTDQNFRCLINFNYFN